MENPVKYRIRVRGVLPDSWYDRLGGLEVTARKSDMVTLEGPLQDQSALAGVLNTLFMLHLPILEVACLNEN